MKRYRIQFPKIESSCLQQNETYFYLQDTENPRKIKLHDYDKLYSVPGLYEQIFYDRLMCTSPSKVAAILDSAVSQSNNFISRLRVLDLGAGNGMMGEELKKRGVCRLIGVDIIKEAYEATFRDRPELYDAYYVEDFTRLPKEKATEIASWQCDCLVTVAALGFNDIPAEAFVRAFNIIKDQGWIAFNIKETFLDRNDKSGFSKTIRELIFSKYLDIYHIERYQHRLSVDGEPLFYYAVAGRKNADVSTDFMKSIGIIKVLPKNI